MRQTRRSSASTDSVPGSSRSSDVRTASSSEKCGTWIVVNSSSISLTDVGVPSAAFLTRVSPLEDLLRQHQVSDAREREEADRIVSVAAKDGEQLAVVEGRVEAL